MENEAPPENPPALPGPETSPRVEENSRRDFLKRVGRRAAYLTPIVLTLTAREARAGSGFHSTCGDAGSPCLEHADCCTGLLCVVDMMTECRE
jgi:hypothetical protein